MEKEKNPLSQACLICLSVKVGFLQSLYGLGSTFRWWGRDGEDSYRFCYPKHMWVFFLYQIQFDPLMIGSHLWEAVFWGCRASETCNEIIERFNTEQLILDISTHTKSKKEKYRSGYINAHAVEVGRKV